MRRSTMSMITSCKPRPRSTRPCWGYLKLKDRAQRVEIRVVLHRLTAPIIVETCRWIARNLPFVDHVALMGLENTGFAIANDAMLWMDPMDYCEPLAKAVDHLVAAGVTCRSIIFQNVSFHARFGPTPSSPFPSLRNAERASLKRTVSW